MTNTNRQPKNAPKSTGGQFARDTSGATDLPTPSTVPTEPVEYAPADLIASVNQAWRAYQAKPERHGFTPWAVDPSLGVCGECGKESGNEVHGWHNALPSRDPRYLPYEDAMWRWTVSHGGIPSVYGGFETTKSIEVKMHLAFCGVDKTRSFPPKIEQISQFQDSGTDNVDADVSAARITCECGGLENVLWRLDQQQSVNEIVFEVVQQGDESFSPPDRGEPEQAYAAAINKSLRAITAYDENKAETLEYFNTQVIPAIWNASYSSCIAEHSVYGHRRRDITEADDADYKERAWRSVLIWLRECESDIGPLYELIQTPKDDNGKAYHKINSHRYRDW